MTRALDAHALVGLALMALGVILLVSAQEIDVSPAVVLLGPRLFPSLVALALMVLGALTVARAISSSRGRLHPPRDSAVEAQPENDWPSFLIALSGPVLFLVAVESLGFAVAAALLFACTARAFGSRRPLADLAIGLVVGGAIFVVFAWGLGLLLPVGSLFSSLLGG